jgi:hypothetical protein
MKSFSTECLLTEKSILHDWKVAWLRSQNILRLKSCLTESQFFSRLKSRLTEKSVFFHDWKVVWLKSQVFFHDWKVVWLKSQFFFSRLKSRLTEKSVFFHDWKVVRLKSKYFWCNIKSSFVLNGRLTIKNVCVCAFSLRLSTHLLCMRKRRIIIGLHISKDVNKHNH